MITWFDALLVTLWAVLTALGARRGLAGLAWALLGVVVCFLANLLGGALVSTVAALLLGLGCAVMIVRLLPTVPERPWDLLAGGLGGLVLGGVLIAALALSLPLDVQGKAGVYPSVSLPPVLYSAARDSAIQNGLRGVWGQNDVVRTLLIPDQTRGQ